jgi:hypothetical protein
MMRRLVLILLLATSMGWPHAQAFETSCTSEELYVFWPYPGSIIPLVPVEKAECTIELPCEPSTICNYEIRAEISGSGTVYLGVTMNEEYVASCQEYNSCAIVAPVSLRSRPATVQCAGHGLGFDVNLVCQAVLLS